MLLLITCQGCHDRGVPLYAPLWPPVRNLVKNLVLGYVQASDHKKPEVLKLIAKILNFSPHELQQVYTENAHQV